MKTRRPPCLDWREKLALRHEDLAPADQQALDAHVRTCEACASALADYHFFEARLDALPPPAIKPLPRLSPHFFERATQEVAEPEKQPESRKAAPTSRFSGTRKARQASAIVRRFLSVAAVILLLLSAGTLFRVFYITHLASHPSGNTLFNLDQHTESVNAVRWSPDGQYIATASLDHTVKVWNASTGNLVCTYMSADEVYALAWSPTSKFIASGGNDDAVHIWNATTCSPGSTYATHTEAGPVVSIAWSPDGKFIASGGWGDNNDNQAQVWNSSTGTILFAMTPFTDVVSSIAWSPNGQEIAVGSWDRSAEIWSVQTRQTLQSYSDFIDPVNAVAWSPDGRYLAIAKANKVEVWDTNTNKLVCTYNQHTAMVNAVAWSPNGKEIASGSDDKTVRIWNPFSPSTPTLMVYTQHTNAVTSVAWSPDGKEIVSGSFDNTAKVWAVIV
jgi:WD40 repeat protein